MKYFATFSAVSGSTLYQVDNVMDETQTPTGVAAMYSAPLVECPPEVQIGWYYNKDTGTFVSPEEYERDKDLYKVKQPEWTESPDNPSLPRPIIRGPGPSDETK